MFTPTSYLPIHQPNKAKVKNAIVTEGDSGNILCYHVKIHTACSDEKKSNEHAEQQIYKKKIEHLFEYSIGVLRQVIN